MRPRIMVTRRPHGCSQRRGRTNLLKIVVPGREPAIKEPVDMTATSQPGRRREDSVRQAIAWVGV